jgi:sigma-B regulation protein RsbU (phosphoserine phosphatase)
MNSLNPAWEPVLSKELAAEVNRERRKMQDLFSALAFALRSFKNLNQVLELIAFVASRLTDADGGALLLFNPNGTIHLEQVHCSNVAERAPMRRLIERVTQNLRLFPDRSYLFDSPEHHSWIENVLDQELQQHLSLEGKKIYGTPLLVQNSLRGRLYVFSHQPDYTWSEDRQQLLRVIADQAAVAIENDTLTAELRKKIALDKELEIGSEIQAQLLPRQYPEIPGIALAARCQTANKVGGDYYDFIRIPTPPGSNPQGYQRLGIVIGDVMGKGVPAGLLMTMTRGMLRAEVLNQHSPARILEHLNQVMFSDLENSNRFISLFYSDYDPLQRQLSFSNAAHNPTLWWRAATQTIEHLDTPGSLIGLDPCSTFEESSVQLEPGDVVVYYTDGFTEAANDRGERLEESGLEEAIQYASLRFEDPQAILESLFQRVEAFRQNNRQDPQTFPFHLLNQMSPEELSLYPPQAFQERRMSQDDMTLVVLKVLPELGEKSS